jgi:1-deoxy-D-xylulose-5-phosphate synthase
LGKAIARDLQGENHHVVAVIGDGAITGGMAFEALNQSGHLGTRLIVVLNDNGMAISPSVGALSRLFYRLRLDRRYHRAKEEAGQVVTRLPRGRQMWKLAARAKKSFKVLIVPSMFWEELGFAYMGPFDGHDIAELEAALAQAREYSNQPTLVHVITQKGKGHIPAEEDAVGFHGVSPSQHRKEGSVSYSDIFGKAVLQLAQEDPKVVAITAAMTDNTGLNVVAREFPFFPIFPIYSTFLQRALDQIIHDVCLQKLPVIFTIDRGGIVGEDGKTHQGAFDLSYLRFVPNMVVASPKDECELQHLLYTAVRANCPFAIRYPRDVTCGAPLHQELWELPIGRGEVLRVGNDMAIIAIGATVAPSLEAAQNLTQSGIGCTVVNARFVKPLDSSLILDLARRTKRMVIVEENAMAGGFGSAVLEFLASSGTHDVDVELIGLPDEFVEHGPQRLLRANYGLDAEGIARRVLFSFPELAPLTQAKT